MCMKLVLHTAKFDLKIISKVNNKEHLMDALALEGDERRDTLR